MRAVLLPPLAPHSEHAARAVTHPPICWDWVEPRPPPPRVSALLAVLVVRALISRPPRLLEVHWHCCNSTGAEGGSEGETGTV